VKIPRDCTGPELVKSPRKLGYTIVRQSGSHIIMTTQRGGEYHVTVPNHRPIKVGTLQDTLKDIAAHHRLTVEQLLRELEL
jgi:predicted RNA binding protein YcfA (HicA-like mRNA interferase family)